MGLSVVYKEISRSSFEIIKERTLNKKDIDLEQYIVDDFFIEKSFMGLEFVLIKGLGERLKDIFCGNKSICAVDFNSPDFKKLDIDEQFEIYDSTPQVSYLSPSRISELCDIITDFNSSIIDEFYDAEELNSKNVYPECWHNDNSDDKVYNARDLKECFDSWKDFLFKVNNKKENYIIIE